MRATIAVLALLLVLPTDATAQKKDKVRCANAAGKKCGDSRVPQYYTPGRFKEALARAKKTKRPLLVKGVAFGMDAIGATQPTKGHW